MIFKVDFEKAYDSVRWDYLDDILKFFGFDDRWCGWIQSCLRSSRDSVIMNGSLTCEFQFHRGLKQSDPLSPFLFILIMKSLHISVQRVVDAGMFRGISMGLSLHLSHLFYADDAVFMGHWSDSNIDTIVQVLECFYHASAAEIGCATLKAPFSYLRSKVGGLMSRVQYWNKIVNNLVTRLPNWKMNTLSISGRLTLLKLFLGSMPIYHMSLFKVPIKVLQRMESIRCHFFNDVDHNGKKPIWVKWSKVLASKEKGGLGVSSFYALNRALLIHGKMVNFGKNVKISFHPSFIWLDIVREMEQLKNHNTDLIGCIHKKMGNRADTSFWDDIWRGDGAFKSLYPRIYALETCKNVTVQFREFLQIMEDVALVDMRDRWVWSLEGSEEFSVASTRRLINKC
ncbi:RNA-directed DNA polymerase, eukaryota, reverse transcriptase zinc-binding domain protein [Tanacetum coccineum]